MTPLPVLLFRVDPLVAVSSDVVASLVMKPIGGGVHLRRGSVHRGIVAWLALGSVPSAFLGVLLLRSLGDGEDLAELLGGATWLAVVAAGAFAALTATVGVAARRRAVVPEARPLPG